LRIFQELFRSSQVVLMMFLMYFDDLKVPRLPWNYPESILGTSFFHEKFSKNDVIE